MEAKEFDFYLPPDRIAQQAIRRGQSKLLVINRNQETIKDSSFKSIADFFQPEDCLVINDTKVIAARFWAYKQSTKAKIEIVLHQEKQPGVWTALARPCRRLKPQTKLEIDQECFEVVEILENGKIIVKFQSPPQVRRIINKYGVMPLPPYIKRSIASKQQENPLDRKRYQTIFARNRGSVAAPTAGLHLSQAIINELINKGVNIVPITLHVGWGTFAALPAGNLDQAGLHTEYFNISEESADLINKGKSRGKKIFSCGTTVTRTLEANSGKTGKIKAGSGETDIFIKPGYCWRLVDHLITNFHLPQSSLLMLVCAFAGKEITLRAYQHAIDYKYRFYSYGDAMLVL